MDQWISWVATAATIIAACMTASNLGTRITGSGFIVFTVGSIAWIAVALMTGQSALLWTNIVLTFLNLFLEGVEKSSVYRVAGTAVFMTGNEDGVPPVLLHHLKHNKVLHERVILLTVQIKDVPYVDADKRSDLRDYGSGFYRLVIRFGFMEEVDVPAMLRKVEGLGAECKMMDTSFFLARQTLLASSRPGMAIWRE